MPVREAGVVAPFAWRIFDDAISAKREVRGWHDHGYDAEAYSRVIRVKGLRISVWVVLVWDQEDADEDYD